MSSKLLSRFDNAMHNIYKRAKDEAGYTASIFLDMIYKNGGLVTAKQLINATKPSDGYTALYERGRLDLTVEAVVLEDELWHSLFTSEELKRARKRLKDYGYVPSNAAKG